MRKAKRDKRARIKISKCATLCVHSRDSLLLSTMSSDVLMLAFIFSLDPARIMMEKEKNVANINSPRQQRQRSNVKDVEP